MALISDIIIWSAITLLVGSGVGVLIGKAYFNILKRKEEKEAIEFLKGNKLNNLKLDGEIININKFVVKTNSGKIIKMGVGLEVDKFEFQNDEEELVKIGTEKITTGQEKTQPQASKSQRIPFIQRIIPRFGRKGGK